MDYNTTENNRTDINSLSLDKETLIILLLLASIFGLALIFNIIFAILYGCCPNWRTNKQRILLHVLNLGLLFSLAAEVYYKYYEHELWNMGEYMSLNCKTIKFITTAGFGCYIYCLLILAWDSIKHLHTTMLIGQVPEITMCQLVTPVLLSVFVALLIASFTAITTTPIYQWHENNDLPCLCKEAGSHYGKIVQIYAQFHAVVWLYIIPVISFLVVYLHSLTLFGCTVDKIDASINACEEEQLARELKSQRKWLITVKLLVLIYTACFIPITVFKLLTAVFENDQLYHYNFPVNVSVFIRRLSTILQNLLVVISPLVLIIRHEWRKIKSTGTIEVTSL